MGLQDRIRKAFSKDKDVDTLLVPKRTVEQIHVSKLVANPKSRDVRFAEVGIDEILLRHQQTGVIEPVVTRELPDGKYLIVTGESRYLAAKRLGLKRVPCYVQGPRRR